MAFYTAPQLYALARSVGFPASTATKMVAIALRESAGNPNAYNGVAPDSSYGLWQINMYGPLGPQRLALFRIGYAGALFDPETNARAAYALWGGNDNNLNVAWAINRSPWKEKYEQYLPVAMAAAAAVDGTGVQVASSPPAPAETGGGGSTAVDSADFPPGPATSSATPGPSLKPVSPISFRAFLLGLKLWQRFSLRGWFGRLFK